MHTDAGPLEQLRQNLFYLGKWLPIAGFMGVSMGALGAVFYHGLHGAEVIRTRWPLLILLLPVAGLCIAHLYTVTGETKDKGTAEVISTIIGKGSLRWIKAPLIFLATLLTHFFGGSAGREGAALQLGGSLGHSLGALLKLDEGDRRILIMCGMSAMFAALFGTPMAAAFMALEISSVGVLYYAALFPCVIAGLLSSAVATRLGAIPEVFQLTVVPTFSMTTALHTLVLALLCACVSILFCVVMHGAHRLFSKAFPNLYLRAVVGGAVIVVLSFVFGLNVYNGGGVALMEGAFHGRPLPPFSFLVKLLFTAITLGSGFKGGEIVPSFFVGASFGHWFASLSGSDPLLSMAVGMIGVFCGATNCPITALLIAFEMFGYEGMPYFLMTVAISYTLSGYYSIFGTQRIAYSKLYNAYVNRDTH